MWYCNSLSSPLLLSPNSLFGISLNKNNVKIFLMKSRLSFILLLSFSFLITSCSEEDDDNTQPQNNTPTSQLNVPENYEFSRNGNSSVSYSGQTERMNQLAEIKAKIQSAGDNQTVLDGDVMYDMYINAGGNANGEFSFTSSKQLKDKTFALDQDYYGELFRDVEHASDSANRNITAADGVAGSLPRSNGSVMLLDSRGHEFTQAIEKGLMGATFYHQIVNVYLSDDKIGETVDNSTIESGKNYTAMEHHMDEAFGYFGAPTDLKSSYQGNGSPSYWAKYSNNADSYLKLNDKIMDAYKTARAAIVAKDRNTLMAQVKVLNEEFEVLIAATTIHYINSSLSETNTGDRIHMLSEAFYFLKALRYSNTQYRKISQNKLNTLLYTDFGENLWQVTTSGLNKVKDELSSVYGLDSVKDQL